jgi:putative endonuclease
MLSSKEYAAYIGRLGEDKTVEYLKSKGCIIIKRNWRDRYGELDIVADDGKNIIFVEVKTRSEGALVSGLEAMNVGKIRRTRNAAEMFMKRLHSNLPMRIDVSEVVIQRQDNGTLKGSINYIKNAI